MHLQALLNSGRKIIASSCCSRDFACQEKACREKQQRKPAGKGCKEKLRGEPKVTYQTTLGLVLFLLAARLLLCPFVLILFLLLLVGLLFLLVLFLLFVALGSTWRHPGGLTAGVGLASLGCLATTPAPLRCACSSLALHVRRTSLPVLTPIQLDELLSRVLQIQPAAHILHHITYENAQSCVCY